MEEFSKVFITRIVEKVLRRNAHCYKNMVVRLKYNKDIYNLEFEAVTFNDEYSKVVTYKGYVEEAAGAVIITKVNDVNLIKSIETPHGTRYEANFITLEI